MKILSIDPGSAQSAYVIWDGSRLGNREILPNGTMQCLVAGCAELGNVDVIAIEKIASYGMSVGAEVFETCVWTGRFMQSWLDWQETSTLIRIPRIDVKVHLCKVGNAKDSNIRQALIDRLGAPGTKKAPGVTFGVSKDIWAALAVGVTVFDRIQCGYYTEAA